MPFPILPSNSASGYFLTKSLRFRSSASATLSRTPASASNRKTWTFSAWIKRGNSGTYPQILTANYPTVSWFVLGFGNDETLQIAQTAGSSASWRTSAVFRDFSAWYHVVCVVDTTSATSTMNGSSTDRFRLYVNNVQYVITGGTIPSQNADLQINNNVSHTIGGYSGEYFDGYMDEVNFVDGQALTPSSFGSYNSLTGVWQPAKYSGTYGTNGYYLPFTTTTSTSTLGNDFSGNGNNWTTNNFSLTAGSNYDSMNDVPTLTSATVANYAVLNPLGGSSGGLQGTLSNGNLTWTSPGTDQRCVLSTMPVNGNSTDKWYWEVTAVSKSSTYWAIGIFPYNINQYSATSAYAQYRSDGAIFVNGSNVATVASYTSGDVIGLTYNSSTNELAWYKNNSLQTTRTVSNSAGFLSYAGCGSDSSGGTNVNSINFGQQPFVYTPPTGYLALNTYNLPDSTIVKGNTVMDATLYTGTGGTQSIVNAAPFKPDMVWIKSRSGAYDHNVFDSVRGVYKQLVPNATYAENNYTTSLTAFNSNGFSLGSDIGTNNNGSTFVGWQWQAGQGSSSTNTNGSITTTVSVNATAGFSVVSYTGNNTLSTLGHGLGVAPQFIIVKVRSLSGEVWPTYHVSLGVQYYTLLNTGAASYNNLSNYWGSSAPTSTTFSINAYGGINQNGQTYIAYCWAAIPGYSKFGSYTGTFTSDGPFVYTGFRPKFVMLKASGDTGTWNIIDSTRNTSNVENARLFPNLSNAENTATVADFLANGFKIRSSDSDFNYTTQYIYMAFAENPFKNALAR